MARATAPARVAIASRDGELIDECFGRAGSYRIYEADGSGYRFREERPGPRPCRRAGAEDAMTAGHDPQALAAAVAIVADCDLVLAGRIGPEALRLLDKSGVAGFAVHISIAEALAKLARRA